MSKPLENLAILTLVHNRKAALINMLNGILSGSLWPSEVLVVCMNEEALLIEGSYPFPIRIIVLENEAGLNLGAARNLAIQESSAKNNVFLDVDCIPDHQFLETYLNHFVQNDDVLYSGRVRYLPAGFDKRKDWSAHLAEISTPDPVRDELETYSYELFWSLNFGCTKEIFKKIGGFDTRYTGYGGEDTDFAFQARKHAVALHTINACAYHQYHASYQPPLNHLQSITNNASRFFSKWGKWPMEGWLKAFEDQGYVKRTNDTVEIVAWPSETEIEAALRR